MKVILEEVVCTKFDIYVFIVLFSEGNTLQLPVITLQLPVITLQLPVIVFLNCTLHWIKRNNITKTDE